MILKITWLCDIPNIGTINSDKEKKPNGQVYYACVRYIDAQMGKIRRIRWGIWG